MLYGSETWTIKASDARRITAAEMKYMRRPPGYTWTGYKTNEQIAKELKITSIVDKLLEYKRSWIQHANRMPQNRLPRVMNTEEWKESIIVPIHKKGDKTDCNNYRSISLLPTTYKILSNIPLSRLIPYAKEIIGDHQCGFRRKRSTVDHIFCIRQIFEKKWEYNEEFHQLFIDFKKAYDSVGRGSYIRFSLSLVSLGNL